MMGVCKNINLSARVRTATEKVLGLLGLPDGTAFRDAGVTCDGEIGVLLALF